MVQGPIFIPLLVPFFLPHMGKLLAESEELAEDGVRICISRVTRMASSDKF